MRLQITLERAAMLDGQKTSLEGIRCVSLKAEFERVLPKTLCFSKQSIIPPEVRNPNTHNSYSRSLIIV
jgi:hypothetical protein